MIRRSERRKAEREQFKRDNALAIKLGVGPLERPIVSKMLFPIRALRAQSNPFRKLWTVVVYVESHATARTEPMSYFRALRMHKQIQDTTPAGVYGQELNAAIARSKS